MSDTVLKVENLYKRYRLGTVGAASFGEDLQRLWAKIQGKPDPFEQYITANELSTIKSVDEMKALKARYVWALQDINFEVKQGEILGVIGKNGAGKSTLLKILSKTTAPTRGQVKIKGRIASLLEVGTGFHPELTGRENIFLNGHILGMNRHEIRARLDEIIDFAGVEAYLDTPVKRYSSGMYVRLAFAVAAHLLADILIVDEVLAVGDAEFQKKCIGKMKDVSSGQGRAVLFVSHNMAVLQNLCETALILKNGRMESDKLDIKTAINQYTTTISQNITQISQRNDRVGNQKLNAIGVQFLNAENKDVKVISSGEYVKIVIYYESSTVVSNVSVALSFNSILGENKIILWSELLNKTYHVSSDGKFECIVPKFPLSPGTYSVNIFIREQNGEIVDWIIDAFLLEVQEGDFFKTGRLTPLSHQSVLVDHNWQ
ncbi:ABC transporter ATP-binding protein [Rhodoflexus caldus]|uniref:ABC transporter ATP-binding protein n=1 Tax=Rhodoflexus caldus TaxID=2891236 RepID=UPI002029CFF1|nr:ABC transporter ATP-binding protein [Rhodoflexus caldus]